MPCPLKKPTLPSQFSLHATKIRSVERDPQNAMKAVGGWDHKYKSRAKGKIETKSRQG